MADKIAILVCLLFSTPGVMCHSNQANDVSEFFQETKHPFHQQIKTVVAGRNANGEILINPVVTNGESRYQYSETESIKGETINLNPVTNSDVVRNSYITNFDMHKYRKSENIRLRLKDGEVITYNPGYTAPGFEIWTLHGKFEYPSISTKNTSIFIHVFDQKSGFLECIWNSDEALLPLIKDNSTSQYIFIPKWAGIEDKYGAKWMSQRMEQLIKKNILPEAQKQQFERFHFSVLPLQQLGNWIPALLWQWQCVDHNCGLDQILIQSSDEQYPRVLKRLDAHYDWLPNPVGVFGNKTVSLVSAGNGCQASKNVNNSVALVTNGSCSYFQKVDNMARSGAQGVVVVADKSMPLADMNCNVDECSSAQLTIPATMIENSEILAGDIKRNVTFQNTPSENFFAAIDPDGRLAEVGWFLYPSMMFVNWQSKWFEYKQNLNKQLQNSEMTVEIFKDQVMQGNTGVVVNVTLPDISALRKFSKLELDMSLSCPGTRDTTCGHWDHTINLYVCCNKNSSLCGKELGRWISAFRRRIGRWLTDVSSLLPLLNDDTCTLAMKTAPWAMPWLTSLNLQLSQPRKQGDLYPDEAYVLYQPGATFDKNYNSHFKPYTFKVPSDVKKVEIFAVITGHGSDENGCGEFCVTSHHFNVNGHINNITFSDAGTPFGCADQVSTGVEPNEHGTWLYGRNGWCDGRNVFPWVIDITDQVSETGTDNKIQYFGWFNGTDPNPKQNPGVIYIQSYLIFYRTYTTVL